MLRGVGCDSCWVLRGMSVISRPQRREFEKILRRRRGQRRLKMKLYFTYESRDIPKSFTLSFLVTVETKLNLEHDDKFEIESQKISHRG